MSIKAEIYGRHILPCEKTYLRFPASSSGRLLRYGLRIVGRAQDKKYCNRGGKLTKTSQLFPRTADRNNKDLGRVCMTGIAKTGYSYSLTEILTQQSAAAEKKQTPRQTLLDNIKENDPQKVDDLKKKMDSADQVVAQLRTGKINEMKQRKKEAADKVKRIKQEIQMLKTMGGDPKVLARRIAQLAKELAQAAREYASSTASANDTASQDGTQTTNAAAGTSETAVSMLKDATGLGGIDVTSTAAVDASANTSDTAADTSDAAATASDGTAPASGQEEKGKGASDSSQHGTNPQGVSLGEGLRQYQEAQRQKLVGDVENAVSDIKQKTAEAEADRQFAQDVRSVSAMLKALADQLKRRLHRAGDYTADQDFNKTDKALADAEKSVASLGASAMSSSADAAAAVTAAVTA
jgi:hypothetical protein